MKARIKETGEIIEVRDCSADMYVEKFGELTGRLFHITELDFDILESPDYWTRLEHQYAGMAMQRLLSNERCWEENPDKIAEVAICYAKELVKGLRIERSN